uniref:lipocalin family protein n=1 Tax=Thaumasiovibrio occultus TaxID=1891184 RepID=UPI000B356488|nr:lipocalin family protein [Thaumasiovibrio occultus]
MKKWRQWLTSFTAAMALAGCSGLPEDITPVDNFDIDRYLGTWYEIARLDHRFERGLEQISATYSLNDDGTVKVLNRGRDIDSGEWKEAEGKAKFVGEPTVAHLKVSFFGPFYGGYGVFYLAPDYSSALIVGNSKDYFWLLSRDPQLSEIERERLIAIARDAGIATDELIWVQHD